MPKMKTRRGAAKRIRINASGKVRFKRAYLRHGLTSRPKSAKRKLRHTGTLSAADTAHAKAMLPYG